MPDQSQALHDEDDLEAILKIAVGRDLDLQAASLRKRLEQAASELGVSPEALAEAEAQHAREREERLAKARKDAARKQFRATRVRAFVHHAATYLAVNAGLFAMNLMSSGRPTWVLWVLAGWGIGLLSDAADTFFSDLRDERKFERWYRKSLERGEP